MGILTAAAAQPVKADGGPKQYSVVTDEDGAPRGPVSDEQFGYQLVQDASGQPFVVNARHDALSGQAPLDAINKRNVERHALDVKLRALDADIKERGAAALKERSEERDALVKARKGLPKIDADRSTRVASALMLYEAEEG